MAALPALFDLLAVTVGLVILQPTLAARTITEVDGNEIASKRGKCLGDTVPWCQALAREVYTAPESTARMARLDTNNNVLFFYRGSSENVMELTWKGGMCQSFGRLFMRGVLPWSDASGRALQDTRQGGGMYVYTRVANKKVKDTWATGSVGTSDSWKLIFKKAMGDRLDWWYSGSDLGGKTPIKPCSDCVWEWKWNRRPLKTIAPEFATNTRQQQKFVAFKDIVNPRKYFAKTVIEKKSCEAYAQNRQSTKREKVINNGCGGFDDIRLSRAGFGNVLKGKAPANTNEQGFLGTIDLAKYLQCIAVVDRTPDCTEDSKELAKEAAVAKLKDWNLALCNTFDCDAKVVAVCVTDKISSLRC